MELQPPFVAPSISEIEAACHRLKGLIITTPVVPWISDTQQALLGESSEVFVKLELMQHGGSFKIRGALMVMFSLSKEELQRGVTAVSAGNHAIAVGYAARLVGTTAKVVMPKSANPARVKRCAQLGTEVVLVDDVQQAFAKVKAIQEEEGRTFVHPFEGPLTAIGTGTVGFEYYQAVPELDALIIPIGGGGLAAGMAAAMGQLHPACDIYGVEPEGADTMSRSFVSGKPEAIDKVRTIADSLGAPFAKPYSFSLCKQYLKEVVRINDDEIRSGMATLFHELKLAVEPAGAASLAALLGPLRERLAGKKVGLIACGANIDIERFYTYVKAGLE